MDLSHNTRIICDHYYTFWIYIVGTRGSKGVILGEIWPKMIKNLIILGYENELIAQSEYHYPKNVSFIRIIWRHLFKGEGTQSSEIVCCRFESQ